MSALTLAVAQQIAEAALSAARARGFRPMAVAVVDAAGAARVVLREDGATPLRNDIALGKAGAAAGMGVSSRELAQRAASLPAFFGAIAAAASHKFIPQTGAVTIVGADGAVLGAVGASGGTSDEDEQVCIAGVEAAGLRTG